MTRKDQMV